MRILKENPARRAAVLLFLAAATAAGIASAQQPGKKASPDVERGRYLVQVAGCNDCHTPGYLESAGKVDEKDWLTGSPLGWRGPWGTTYGPNLRLAAAKLTEAQWLPHARNEWRPPMPWFNLRKMSDADLTAIYRYLQHAGPAGKPAPAALPPGQEPKGPFVQFPAPPK
jgi:mono/diheme cytochrome c family protein